MSVRMIRPAEAYREGALQSVGNAAQMYIRQFNFPGNDVDEKDMLLTRDHDHLLLHDIDRVETCIEEHTGNTDYYLGGWVRSTTDEKIIGFLIDVLSADIHVNWTGYRILGSVGGNGYPVWTLQLFAKHPESKTEVFTGPNAPNVLPGRRY